MFQLTNNKTIDKRLILLISSGGCTDPKYWYYLYQVCIIIWSISSHLQDTDMWSNKSLHILKAQSWVFMTLPHSPFLNRQTWDFQSRRPPRLHGTPVCWLYVLPVERRWSVLQLHLCSEYKLTSVSLLLLYKGKTKINESVRCQYT